MSNQDFYSKNESGNSNTQPKTQTSGSYQISSFGSNDSSSEKPSQNQSGQQGIYQPPVPNNYGGGYESGRGGYGRGGYNSGRGGYGNYGRGGYGSNSGFESGSYGRGGYGRGGFGRGGYSGSYGRGGYGYNRGGYGYNRGGYGYNRGYNSRYGKDEDNERDELYDSVSGWKTKMKEKQIFQNYTVGINFDKYDDIPVRCFGNNIPECIESFDKEHFPKLLQDNIKRARYIKPTPVQKYCIPIALKGRDIMACAETGSGKTAGFLFPLISDLLNSGCKDNGMARKPEGLILAPTRELAQQIYGEALKFCYKTPLKVTVVFGGIKLFIQEKYLPGTNILIATPGRLNDMIKRGYLSMQNLKFFVLDEGDRMLDMGFLPQIDQIVQSGMSSKDKRQTMMFSATFPKEIRMAANRYLKDDYIFVAVGKIGGTTKNVVQDVRFVNRMDKDAELDKVIKNHSDKRMLVFLNTKQKVDELYFKYSMENKIAAGRIHGDRNQKQRDYAIEKIKKKQIQILFCTDVLARGIDIGNLEMVVNYDVPKNIDDYVHRIGRTGRVGNSGKAISFFSYDDANIAKDLITELTNAKVEVPKFLYEYQYGNKKSKYGSSGYGNRGYGNRGYGNSYGNRSGYGYQSRGGFSSWKSSSSSQSQDSGSSWGNWKN